MGNSKDKSLIFFNWEHSGNKLYLITEDRYSDFTILQR
jgi:hypothetical protein